MYTKESPWRSVAGVPGNAANTIYVWLLSMVCAGCSGQTVPFGRVTGQEEVRFDPYRVSTGFPFSPILCCHLASPKE